MSSHRRGCVLVVDDEPTIGEVVARYLERAGYGTRVARDGPAALAAASERRPDLVLLDLMLPGVDGLEVMRRLREGDGRPIAIILLTARDEECDPVTGLRLGADDYVVKPFSPAEVVARVDAVLRRALGARRAGGRRCGPEERALATPCSSTSYRARGREPPAARHAARRARPATRSLARRRSPRQRR